MQSETCCTRLAENTGPKKSPSRHHRTALSGCIFATKACIDNLKKLVKTAISPLHVLTIMVNLNGSPTAEIGSLVWGTPANFNGFCVLAVLLHGTVVVGVSQLCDVEQRAPPIFGRAAITLGIGPHSSSCRLRRLLACLPEKKTTRNFSA